MNVPAFCLLIGDIQLKEVSAGSIVYDIANAEVSEEEELFTYEMTGSDMYSHYLELTPRTRLHLEDTCVLNKAQWQVLVKEVETKTFVSKYARDYDRRSRDLLRNGCFAAIVTACYMIATTVFIGYITNLNYNNEPITSVILQVFTEVVKETPKISQDGEF